MKMIQVSVMLHGVTFLLTEIHMNREGLSDAPIRDYLRNNVLIRMEEVPPDILGLLDQVMRVSHEHSRHDLSHTTPRGVV